MIILLDITKRDKSCGIREVFDIVSTKECQFQSEYIVSVPS